MSCLQGARGAGVSAAQLGAEAEEEGANSDGSSEVPSASAGEGEGVLGGGEVGDEGAQDSSSSY